MRREQMQIALTRMIQTTIKVITKDLLRCHHNSQGQCKEIITLLILKVILKVILEVNQLDFKGEGEKCRNDAEHGKSHSKQFYY